MQSYCNVTSLCYFPVIIPEIIVCFLSLNCCNSWSSNQIVKNKNVKCVEFTLKVCSTVCTNCLNVLNTSNMHAAIVVCYNMVCCYSEHSHNTVSTQREKAERCFQNN